MSLPLDVLDGDVQAIIVLGSSAAAVVAACKADISAGCADKNVDIANKLLYFVVHPRCFLFYCQITPDGDHLRSCLDAQLVLLQRFIANGTRIFAVTLT